MSVLVLDGTTRYELAVEFDGQALLAHARAVMEGRARDDLGEHGVALADGTVQWINWRAVTTAEII